MICNKENCPKEISKNNFNLLWSVGTFEGSWTLLSPSPRPPLHGRSNSITWLLKSTDRPSKDLVLSIYRLMEGEEEDDR